LTKPFSSLDHFLIGLDQPPPAGWRRRKQADGVLFFHRRTGLNVLLDEVIPEPEDVDCVPRYVQWSLLDACNLRCDFCAASKGGKGWKWDAITKLLRGLDAWGVMEVAFAGGEPMLHPDVIKIVRFVGEETGMIAHLTTNGLWSPPDFVAQVQEHIGQVRVSVDGLGAVYEAMRGVAFSELEAGLTKLKGLRLGLNCLVTAQTLGQMPDYFAWAASRGIRDILLLKPVGPGAALLPDGWRPRLVEIILGGIERGFRISTSSAFGVLPGVPALSAGGQGCGCGKAFLFITSDGRAKVSSTSRQTFSFGDVGGLQEIYKTQFAAVEDCGCPRGGEA
jgi:MoaA/NifB/PqqE/SkfB family radical SAM enzyme